LEIQLQEIDQLLKFERLFKEEEFVKELFVFIVVEFGILIVLEGLETIAFLFNDNEDLN